jgi:hypothetical protein
VLLITSVHDSQSAPATNTFVLKTCRAKDASLHHNEVNAYKILGGQHDVSSNMVRFYGSWSQGLTYNMLLEHVGGGTLEDFFARTDPPTKGEDIVRLWDHLSQSIKPVARMHKFPHPYNKRGYHQG